MDLAEMVYKLTASFPADERFGLTAQMRRAAYGVPANIAEGAARRSKKELLQFLHVSRASLSELDTFLDLSKRLNYLRSPQEDAVFQLVDRTDQLLSGLIRSHTQALNALRPMSSDSRLTSHDSRKL
jgi:four helix bundle protein